MACMLWLSHGGDRHMPPIIQESCVGYGLVNLINHEAEHNSVVFGWDWAGLTGKGWVGLNLFDWLDFAWFAMIRCSEWLDLVG